MKKMILCAIALLLMSGAVGCTKEELRVGEITANTMVARADGELQVATIEAFDKDYYSLEELKGYVQEQVDNYNTKAGGEKIKIDDIDKKENNAVMILTYSGMEHYSGFNEEYGAYFSGGVDNISLKLPSTLVNAKDGSLVSTDEVLKDEKNRVLVLNEPYRIIVDGKIKYYSEKATLVDNNKIDGAAEDMTIVVFKK